MARLPRLSVPGYPYHIIQRGNNREVIFSCAADRQVLLDLLHEYGSRFGVAVHAYVLMDNHYHLLVTPQSPESLPKMMQSLGRRYVRHFNDTHGRSGTLWEGRYKSALIQTDRYLLACMVYMDLNPVRAGMVAHPRAYPWSSHGHYCGLRTDPVVTPHPLVWELGNTPFARESSYSDLVHAGVSAQQQADLAAAVVSGWPLGDADFVAALQKTTHRRLSKAAVGRPAGSRAH
jgi:putative transposase